MTATNDIPRIGPAHDDGSGARSLYEQWDRDARTIAARFNAKPEPADQLRFTDDAFVVTYRLDDDERDEWTALCAALDREAVMAEAAAIVRAQRQSAMNLRRDRENAAALDQLHERAPLLVACPACDGQRPRCPACHGRAWVSPFFASTWERQGA